MTAKEFIIKEFSDGYIPPKYKESIVEDLMIDFAKYHTKKALEVASKNLRQASGTFNSDYNGQKISILNAYPLDNIK